MSAVYTAQAAVNTTRTLAPVDIICGGSPCQDLSVASCTRAGLAGAFVRLPLECDPGIKEMRDGYTG